MHDLAPRDEDLTPPRIDTASLDDVFEVITRAVFQAGLHWSVVDRRWPAFEHALEGFDVHAVAGFGDAEADELARDPELIRNPAKVAAMLANARALVELERSHGSFAAWLDEHDGYDAACTALRSRFAYLGDFGATWTLWVLGGPTPPYADWSRLGGATRGRAAGAGGATARASTAPAA